MGINKQAYLFPFAPETVHLHPRLFVTYWIPCANQPRLNERFSIGPKVYVLTHGSSANVLRICWSSNWGRIISYAALVHWSYKWTDFCRACLIKTIHAYSSGDLYGLVTLDSRLNLHYSILGPRGPYFQMILAQHSRKAHTGSLLASRVLKKSSAPLWKRLRTWSLKLRVGLCLCEWILPKRCSQFVR